MCGARDLLEEGPPLLGPLKDGAHGSPQLVALLVVVLAQLPEHDGEALDALQPVKVRGVAPALATACGRARVAGHVWQGG